MSVELTNDEVLKVFQFHLPCNVLCCKQTGWPLSQKKHFADIWFFVQNMFRVKSLYLFSLENLSDEHAVLLSKFVVYGKCSNAEMMYIGHATVKFHYLNHAWDTEDEFDTARNRDFIVNLRPWAAIAMNEWLKSKRYAVPLYFSPGHWANGKTAIELNVALEEE